MNQIQLLIFDMDGLMFDTGRLAYEAYLKAAKQYDFDMVHGVYYYLTGRTEKGIVDAMAELYGGDKDVLLWRKAIHTFRNEILAAKKRVYKKKGLLELLDFARERGLQTAVASSTAKEKVKEYLKLENIEGCFDHIVAGDEVAKGKPDKEIFVTACKKAGVSPREALVMEDSLVGIQAADNGGIRSVLIPDDITDMPVYKGKYPLLKDLDVLLVQTVEPHLSFSNLDKVRQYLEERDLFLA